MLKSFDSILVDKIMQHAWKTYMLQGGKETKFNQYLAGVLKQEPDTVSRKTSGKYSFSMTDLERIIEHFNVDIYLSSPQHQLSDFVFTPLSQDEQYFNAYFESVAAKLYMIQGATESKICITSEDFPIFYYFKYDALAAFKLYFYKYSLYNMGGRELNQDFLTGKLLQNGHDIYSRYCEIPSYELWTPRTLDSTISQLIYLYDIQRVKEKPFIKKIYTEFHELVQHIFENARQGSKNNRDQNLYMFRSDMTLSNNEIYFEADGMKSCFVNFNTFNSIQLNRETYVDEVKNWMDNMFRTGIKISGEGEPSRISLKATYETKLALLEQYLLKSDPNAREKLMMMNT